MPIKRGPDGKIVELPTEPTSDATRRLDRRPSGGRENEPRLGDPAAHELIGEHRALGLITQQLQKRISHRC